MIRAEIIDMVTDSGGALVRRDSDRSSQDNQSMIVIRERGVYLTPALAYIELQLS